jgi:hypothetical protein
MKKLSTALIISAASILIGCGGGGSSSQSDTTILKTQETTIKASDAYVVKLITPATAVCANGKTYTTTTVEDGNVTFELDADVDPNSCKYYIPDDAIVDTDGDGVYSSADLPIRMPLSIEGTGVANPLTTTAMENNDITTLVKSKNFDPVEAKAKLLQENNTTLEALVAASDAIADLVNAAKEQNVSVKKVLQNIDTSALKELETGEVNATELVKQLIEPVTNANPELADDAQKVMVKVETETQLINQLKEHIQQDHIDHKEALALILMATDGDANVSALLDTNLTQEQLQQLQEELKQQLEEKHQEMLKELEHHELNATNDMQEEMYDHQEDMNMSFDMQEMNTTNQVEAHHYEEINNTIAENRPAVQDIIEENNENHQEIENR